jgi:NitT/TauT family transport system substrate-binding protein
MSLIQSRRRFVGTTAAAGAAALMGNSWPALADHGPPETTTLRIVKEPGICIAPQYVAEELLHAEGFSDVRYYELTADRASWPMLAAGTLDLTVGVALEFIREMDAGAPITVLAGVHPGCFELFAHEPVRDVSDLKGRRVARKDIVGWAPQLLLSVMAAYVGLDPARDIEWVVTPAISPMEAFIAHDVDAFIAGPPEPQELRDRGIGRVILSTATDRPWSHYFCCVLGANTAFVRANPIATKRALRAILKAADMCAAEPQRAATRLVDGGFTKRYDYALEALRNVPYAKWREYDPEDTLRFYALRLHELGFIKSSPNKIIAEGTDWRFLNELKRELKA